MRVMRPGRVWRAVVVLVVVVSWVVPAVVVAGSGFSDVGEAGSHRAGVERLEGLGVLDGTECEPGRFCPNEVLERWVMAVWLVRVMDGVDPVLSTATRFVDVDPEQWWAPYVERLAVLGVTVGCATSPARYCPDASVTRGQMATFLKRAFDLAPGPSAGFVDVAGSSHADRIDALAAAGITVGCAVSPARYCPRASVPRGQMATFLTHAIEFFPERTAIGEGEETVVLSVELGSLSSAVVTASFEVEITFSQPVTGFEQGHIQVSNGRVTGLTGSGAVYAATIAPATDGKVVVQIPAGVVSDDENNTNQASGVLSRTYASDPGQTQTDGLSVVLGSSTEQVVTGPFEVEVTFSRPVTGFRRRHIEVVNGRASGLGGSGSSYRVTITPSSEGAVVMQIPRGVVSDRSGDANLVSERLVRTLVSDTSWNGTGYNTWDRSAVVRAYRAEFEREEPGVRFTGDIDACDAGTTNQAFRDSLVQRINWYRQMAGLDTVTERAGYSAAAQQAALMMVAEGRLSHYPSSDWACYTTSGAEAALRSNLALSHVGADAIDAYMHDDGVNNQPVGHRRWILYPRLQEIGTGDVRLSDDKFADSYYDQVGNALYVVGDEASNPDIREPRGFVAWPPRGYVPAQATWSRWHFQLEGGDFSDARVRVTDSHRLVPLEVLDRKSSYGGAGIVWGMYWEFWSSVFPKPPDGDHCYHVVISNVRVAGTTQPPYRYTTCVLDLTRDEAKGFYSRRPAWSPDGTSITYHDGNRVRMISADGTNQRLFLFTGYIEWSPDGTKIAYDDIRGIWVELAGYGCRPHQPKTTCPQRSDLVARRSNLVSIGSGR